MAKFRLKSESSKEKGRAEDVITKELFEKTCHWLESEADRELYTIDDLFMKMQEFNGGEEIICSEKTIKRIKIDMEIICFLLNFLENQM